MMSAMAPACLADGRIPSSANEITAVNSSSVALMTRSQGPARRHRIIIIISSTSIHVNTRCWSLTSCDAIGWER